MWIPPEGKTPSIALKDIVFRANLIMSNNEWHSSGTRSSYFVGYDERLLTKIRELRTRRQTLGVTPEWPRDVQCVLSMVAGCMEVPGLDEWPMTDKCREEAAHKARVKQMESERRMRQAKAKTMPRRQAKVLPRSKEAIMSNPDRPNKVVLVSRAAVAMAAASGGGKGKDGKRTPLADKRVTKAYGPPKKTSGAESHRTVTLASSVSWMQKGQKAWPGGK